MRPETWVGVISLWCAGCGGGTEPPLGDGLSCSDEMREQWAFVPFAWGVHDETTVMPTEEGCRRTTVVHYVLPQGPTEGGGRLPIGYYERQCQWDACDEPPDHRLADDPFDVRIELADGASLPRLGDGVPLVPLRR